MAEEAGGSAAGAGSRSSAGAMGALLQCARAESLGQELRLNFFPSCGPSSFLWARHEEVGAPLAPGGRAAPTAISIYHPSSAKIIVNQPSLLCLRAKAALAMRSLRNEPQLEAQLLALLSAPSSLLCSRCRLSAMMICGISRCHWPIGKSGPSALRMEAM